MTIETRERCDCCGADVTLGYDKNGGRGARVHRREVKSHFRYPLAKHLEQPMTWDTICGECWSAIGRAVRDAREAVVAAHDTERGEL